MTERISSIHLKQFVNKLIQNESQDTKDEIMNLIDRHIQTVKSDKKDLVDGLQKMIDSPEDGLKNAKSLIERFGKMPKIIFSNS